MTNVVLLPNVHTIEQNIFCGCKSLTTIDMTFSVKFLGINAFDECDSIETDHLSKKYVLVENAFPDSAILIYGWYEVGPYILFRELFLKRRSSLKPDFGNNINVQTIQIFITQMVKDIFCHLLCFPISHK